MRSAVAAVAEARAGRADPGDVGSPRSRRSCRPHPCLRRTGLRTQIRDDVDREFAHLGNLHRVVQLQELFASREKVGILLQPDPDPDGIASGLALRALLGRARRPRR